MPYRLSPFTVLRAEEGGALMFQQQTAENALLDMEGLAELAGLVGRAKRGQAFMFARYLRDRGFVVRGSDGSSLAQVEDCIEAAKRIKAPLRSLAAPETIHFSVTGRCDQACAGCFYSARPGSAVEPQDAPLSLFKQVLAEAGRQKVLQVALGGGEPLLHPDIVSMVKYAREHRVVPNLTTNGNGLAEDMAAALKEAGLGQAQISLNGSNADANRATRPNFAAALAAMEACGKAGLPFGINFLLTRSSVAELEGAARLASQLGAATINVLRPKPPTVEGDWLESESMDAAGYRQVLRSLPRVRQAAQPTKLTLDASFTFLLTDRTADDLYRAGVWGCTAARRFCTVIQDGRVLPCSHVRWSDIGDGDFMRAWRDSQVFAQFRRQEDDVRGPCRTCSHLRVCKGCRAVALAFADDFTESDPHCPRGLD